MQLRKLKTEDAPRMLEWMHDKSVVSHLGTDFSKKTLEDCLGFISASLQDEGNLHLAIADDEDTYMGTVSLKHIDRQAKNAEFAITVRACAMGKGFSACGMKEILRMGIEEIGLQDIYWCVSPKNARAVRFYDKHGYLRADTVPAQILGNYPQDLELIWYVYR